MRATMLVNRRMLMIAAFAVAAGALAFTALIVREGGPPAARAADHLDAPGLMPPGGSVQSDITDLYAFQPSNPADTVLVLNVNTGTAGSNFTFGRGIPGVGNTRGVLYNFNIDNNGDAVTDVNLRVRFGQPAADGSQQFELRRNGKLLISMDQGLSTAFGAAPNVVTVGDVKAFAGRRDDPFFFDLAAFLGLNGRSFCDGQQTDFFAGRNVSSIVLELPNRVLTADSAHPKIGVWASTNAGGTQIDRMGRPAINTVFNHGDDKNRFNAGDPVNDRRDFGASFVSTLTALGAADPNGLAQVLLPDILTYDTSSSAGFLNGRQLSNDVIDAELNLITNGKITGDCVANDSTFADTFPYLGSPN
ncbi:MAG: DUF4331 domain-containing protein [Actinobacteria bacterium]|nr:MAG: DUF4331 domain-containing protein [Actinomycetota bacterium]